MKHVNVLLFFKYNAAPYMVKTRKVIQRLCTKTVYVRDFHGVCDTQSSKRNYDKFVLHKYLY